MEIIKKGTKINEELSQLLILEALENDSKLKQRDLSKITGLNLFKVNYLLKKLIDKGYVKIKNVYKNPNKKSYLYWLTPKGFKRKTNLVYRFIKVTLENYDTYVSKLLTNIIELQNKKIKKIIILGDDSAIQIFQKISDPFNFEIVGVTNLNNKNSLRLNLRYIPLDKLTEVEFDKIILLTIHSQEELESSISDNKIEANKLYYLN